MPNLFDRLAARIAYLHARRVHARFLHALTRVDTEQARTLQRVLPLIRGSEFGRRFRLDRVRTLTDLRLALPLMTYEDYRPFIDRVGDGHPSALFSPGVPILMFATSSGTTALPKHVPVTPAFVRDYRRGWNTFGLKLLTDHPRAILRPILQCSGRPDVGVTRAGIPYGAITGLLAQTQKRIVRRYYVGRPEIAYLDAPQARYYTLMRLGLDHDVAFAITASPGTLVQMARTVDEHSEALIRDVRDGGLSAHVAAGDRLRGALTAGLRPNPALATRLDHLRHTCGALRPRDYWRIEFLACWTGGSMGYYLERLAAWWGAVPVRDIGLLASEGRVTVPFEDGTPAGVLDITSGVFEFIPAEDAERPDAPTLGPRDLERDRDYAVVLTNTTGLARYRLDDIVRVRGWLGQAPLVEFLHRAGRVASVAGEKLTENQVVSAIRSACRALGVPEFDFIVAPHWGDPPFYRLNHAGPPHERLADACDRALCAENEEYASRRKSNRLGSLEVHSIRSDALAAMDARLIDARRSTPEQFKRPCLLNGLNEDERLLSPTTRPAEA